MQNFRKRSAASATARRVGVVAALLMASAGAAAAQASPPVHRPANASQYYGLYEGSSGGLSMDQIDHRTFGRSGTIGREGLGGSPRHPEGPGDVSD